MRKSVWRRIAAVILAACITAACLPGMAESGQAEQEESLAPSIHMAGDRYRCGDFVYRVLEDGTAELVEYLSTEEIREIPQTIAGYPVSRIGDRAFSGQGNRYTTDDDLIYGLRDNIHRIIIPEGVAEIGDYAFEDCIYLLEAILPQSLRSIGKGAFSGCLHLTRIRLPEGLQDHPPENNRILYLCLWGWHLPMVGYRALERNRIIR